MSHWWHRNILEPGKLPLLLALLSFLLTFLVTRTITRLIRAGRGPFRNVSPGGLHIHHVVPGIVLLVVGGFGAVGSGRHGVAAGICAVLFGIGAGLVLDEFALIVHLDDVYWSEEGRRSVEVVVLAAALGMLVIGGFSPLGVNDMSAQEQHDRVSLISTLLINFSFVLIALLKGKTWMAIIGVLVPFVALFAAIRLARPGTFWARRFYGRRHRARARSALRAYRHDRRWNKIGRRVQDVIGGAPDRADPPR
ncbi:hypothetical protein G3I40_39685 [Streptomyces sp. SID14478]|uniref:hypothetical protein n=1 Tax=Streptomyces sp. SID14478 TaxID=2706073 RepID=UPI0013E0E39A|nr:hypothetical protein [Streptomyces sp. SID14478]NEB81288.1 hypothetical protein [Streptomyces sp. SID14478]